MTILSIGYEALGAVWDWYMWYQQPFPLLSDEDMSIFHSFNNINVMLDETMKIRYMGNIVNEEEFRTELSALCDARVTIDHVPVTNTENTASGGVVECLIRSVSPLIPSTLRVYWSLDGGSTFNSGELQPGGPGLYSLTLPPFPMGAAVQYYIHAEAENGNIANDPWLAPAEMHSFQVLTDLSAPDLTHAPIPKWPADRWSPVLEAEVSDDLPVGVVLEFERNGGTTQSVTMTRGDTGVWTASFSQACIAGDLVTYRIIATDSSAAQNFVTSPSAGSHELAVVEIMPAAVIDYDPNQSSGPVIQGMLENLGLTVDYFQSKPIHPVIYDSLFLCSGVRPHTGFPTLSETCDFYFYLKQGGNMYMEGGDIWADTYYGEFHRLFGIKAIFTGESDITTISGVAGSFAGGMMFEYAGENDSMDRLRPNFIPGEGTSESLLRNISPSYYAAVTADTEFYRTIGTCFEFSGLVDGASTKQHLMHCCAAYLGLTDPPPTPTPTPPATATPTPDMPCEDLGVTLTMPAHHFAPGDSCACAVQVCNPGPESHTDVPLFVILECAGLYFFWPDFSGFDFETIDLSPGTVDIQVLPAFPWPEGTGAASAVWYAGMTNQNMNELFGEIGTWPFSWE